MKLVFGENKAILSYQMNDGNENILCNNITRDKELNYRLAVYMQDGGNRLELIHFECYKTIN